MADVEPSLEVNDIVETIKGAQFWGIIIALDNDPKSPGCTVMAIAAGFIGCKHVYPLVQLRRRQLQQSPANLFTYTNWRGMTAARKIMPLYVWYGMTEWHPVEQWFVHGWDADKKVERDFQLSGFGWPTANAPGAPTNHRFAEHDGNILGDCARCGKPAADPIHYAIFPGEGSYGDMGVSGDNHFDPSKRGFQPK